MVPFLSGSALKVVAVISMVVDHCACYLLEEGTVLYDAMRCVGRIAFPVFALLLAEGFRHSRNRMKYFLMLLVFAVVSEVPWHLLNGADGTRNVMFTLALGAAALAWVDRLRERRVLCGCSVLLTALLAAWLEVDFGWRGVLMAVLFYLLGNSGKQPDSSCRMLQIMFAFPLMMHYGIMGAALASTVLFLYDGRRGFIRGSVSKYAFYAFYPAHLLVIAFCR